MRSKNKTNILNIQRTPYAEDENAHIVQSKTSIDFNPEKDYKFVRRGKGYMFFSTLLHWIICPILWLFVGKLFFGIKVKGKKNGKKLKKNWSYHNY